MNKFLTKVTSLCVGLAMVAGVGVAFGSKVSEAKAESATVTFADAGWENAHKPTEFTLGGFDFVATKVSGSNAPAYYTSDST